MRATYEHLYLIAGLEAPALSEETLASCRMALALWSKWNWNPPTYPSLEDGTGPICTAV